ncbi:putative silencing supressor [Strawberry chlorotic fleck-associated virus]|uniref:Putative silencing supressor n=1 Tax=Strawberry chlorotic fleck-associated virus TaxID=399314 RepID=Q0GK46_9CLOS|nr:putative silencing supressor [Strawberry chlorotic fleck-associated virus]ABI23190.1 putative silencing supressor [Strawberry chlorotic fleck-associated virus]QZN83662.1 putative silencing supressor [Strawberry chlorotic fleck-associated virus]
MRGYYDVQAFKDLNNHYVSCIHVVGAVERRTDGLKQHCLEFNNSLAIKAALKCDANSDVMSRKNSAKEKLEILTEIDANCAILLKLLRKKVVRYELGVRSMQGTFDYIYQKYSSLHPEVPHSEILRHKITPAAQEVIEALSEEYKLSLSDRSFPGFLVLGVSTGTNRLSFATAADQADLVTENDDFVNVRMES